MWIKILSTVCAVAGLLTGCLGDEEGCEQTSTGVVSFWLEQQNALEPRTVFTGRFQGSGLPNDMGQQRYEFQDSTGTVHVLVAATPGVTLLLDVGASYRVLLESRPGRPTTSSLIIHREKDMKLEFAGAADVAAGTVLHDGVPGWELARQVLDPVDDPDPCFSEERKAKLSFQSPDGTVQLCPGQSDTLGAYELHCLTARKITYNSICSDAGVIETAYMIVSR